LPNKIFLSDYGSLSKLSGQDFKWVSSKNIGVDTYVYKLNKDSKIIFFQRLKETSEMNRELTVYYKPTDPNYDFKNHLIPIGYSYSYILGSAKHSQTFVSVDWINCPLVCKDKKIKNILDKLQNKK
jgi:hypothetical protein